MDRLPPAFIKKMESEEKRPESEGVSQEQLTLYDLLVGIEVTLSKKDKAAVKKIAVDLPKMLDKKLVIDWRKSQTKRAAVRVAIKNALKDLPEPYDELKFEAALEAVYEHVYESYWGDGKSKYVEAAATSSSRRGPPWVPSEIQSEFREAELCAAFGAKRAASALFRSALEKVVKVNGYTKGNDASLKDLQKRIDAAAADRIITDARRKKAHEDVRALGNDVLHDDWREVTDDEVADARHYTQRVLEDFYDDRATVEGILVAKNRIGPPA